VKDILRELLKEITINEEVNVKKLFNEYPSGKDHYDLVIPTFKVIVECHGTQHKTKTSFGEKDPGKVSLNYTTQKYRDKRKREVAEANNWLYLTIWYDALPKKEEDATAYVKSKLIGLFKT